MKKCGIYLITNIINNRKYVGSTERELLRRWSEHKSDLKHGNHPNSHLQRAWNLYGAAAFIFSILELVDTTGLTKEEINATLLEREDYYINKWDLLNTGYNDISASRYILSEEALARRKGRTPWNKGKVGVYSEEHIRKLSAASKGRSQSAEHIEKRVRNRRGKTQKGHPSTPETNIKIAEAKAENYEVTTPKGEVTIIRNISQFCRDNDLDASAMVAVSKSRRKQHKGWKCKKVV